MTRMRKASAWSGVAFVLFFILIIAVRSGDTMEVLSEFSAIGVIAMLYASFVLWGVGATFAFLALVPLRLVADRARPWVSLTLFLAVGFGISAFLGYCTLQYSAHEAPPPIATMSMSDVVLDVMTLGLIGLGCAAVAWVSIIHSRYRDEA
jgi:hypothetical protein